MAAKKNSYRDPHLKGLKLKAYEIIFESDTFAGRLFDLTLIILIISSVIVIILESVESIRVQFSYILYPLEWFFTAVFTIEYALRLWTVPNKKNYVFSFFGFIDLLALLPSYLALVFTGAYSLMVIRSFRLLRIFRILKLSRFIGEGQNLAKALVASRFKIIVFLLTVLTTVVIMGTIMYLVEGPENGYTSIPQGIY